MKKKIFLILLHLASIVLAGLALFHHLQLRFGSPFAGSFCDLGGKVSCDAVALSYWSAPISGIPVAVWAISLYSVLWVDELIERFEVRSESKLDLAYVLSGLASVFYLGVMAVSLQSLCLVCLGIHVCQFTAVTLKFWGRSLSNIFNRRLVFWTGLIAIKILVLGLLIQEFGVSWIMTQNHWVVGLPAVKQWKKEVPPNPTSPAPEVRMGIGAQKEVVITVAADFMCLHCRSHFLDLAKALTARRLKARVRIVLFPRHIQCNPASGETAPGACNAALVGLCQNIDGKFDSFFRNIYETPGRAQGDSHNLIQLESTDAADLKRIELCVESMATRDTLQAHIDSLQRARIPGVPITWVGGYRFEGALSWAEWEKVFSSI